MQHVGIGVEFSIIVELQPSTMNIFDESRTQVFYLLYVVRKRLDNASPTTTVEIQHLTGGEVVACY